ncbi:MAG: glutaredoxin domain-containing protein [Methylobacter sp.]
MTINPSLVLLFALTFVLPVQAEIYKWTDANGKSHFSGSKPANSDSVENRNDLEIKSPQPAPVADKSTVIAAVAPKVDLYMTQWCPYCKKAMAYLRKKDIVFNAYDIEHDLDAAARKKTLDPGYSGIPLAVINGTTIRGFSEDLYQNALAKK